MRAGGWARRGAGSMGVGQPTCSAPGTRPAQRVGSMRQTCWHAGHLLCTVGGQRGVDVLARWAVPVQAGGQAGVLAAWALGSRRAGRRAAVLADVWAACGRGVGSLWSCCGGWGGRAGWGWWGGGGRRGGGGVAGGGGGGGRGGARGAGGGGGGGGRRAGRGGGGGGGGGGAGGGSLGSQYPLRSRAFFFLSLL